MKIALDPRYVHGGFEAQSTAKVAFNRLLRFGLLQRKASTSPANATRGMAAIPARSDGRTDVCGVYERDRENSVPNAIR